MATNAEIRRRYIRRALELIRAANGMNAEAQAELRAIARELRALLAQESLAGMGTRQLSAVAAEVEAIVVSRYAVIAERAGSGLREVTNIEAEFARRAAAYARAPSNAALARAASAILILGQRPEEAWERQGQQLTQRIVAAVREASALGSEPRQVSLSIFGDGPAAAAAPSGNPESVYRTLADCVAAHPTAATRRMALERLRHAEPFEPFNRYNDHLTDPRRGDALTRLRRLLAGYPEAPGETAGPGDFPVARTLVPPVRDYFDPKRKSYGILIDPAGGGPFAGKYHVGDDVAWHQDYETVVAIGDGVVRRVEMGRKSWGGWVVIEHKDLKGGRFCSLYGHLGALIRVKVGDEVGKGQKIGSVGMSYSQENGGFLAHLHFGIHNSAYLVPDRVGEEFRLPSRESETVKAVVTAVNEFTVEYRLPDGRVRSAGRYPNWATGYLDRESFNGPHRWVNPQDFIRQYGK